MVRNERFFAKRKRRGCSAFRSVRPTTVSHRIRTTLRSLRRITPIRHTVSICWTRKGKLPMSTRTGKRRKSLHGAKSPPIPDTRRSWTAFPCPRQHQRKLIRHLAIYPSCFPYRIAVRDYERKSAAGGGCNSRIVQKEIIT